VYDEVAEWIEANSKEFGLRDVKGILEALRPYVNLMAINIELIDLLYERVIESNNSEFNYPMVISMIKSTKEMRLDDDKIHQKLSDVCLSLLPKTESDSRK